MLCMLSSAPPAPARFHHGPHLQPSLLLLCRRSLYNLADSLAISMILPPGAPAHLLVRDVVVLPGQRPQPAEGTRLTASCAEQPNPLHCFAPGRPARFCAAVHAPAVLATVEALVRLLPQTKSAPEMWMAGEPLSWLCSGKSAALTLANSAAPTLAGPLALPHCTRPLFNAMQAACLTGLTATAAIKPRRQRRQRSATAWCMCCLSGPAS